MKVSIDKHRYIFYGVRERSPSMTTFTSPELVAAIMSERRRAAANGRLHATLRLARDCCATAASPFRRLFRRRPATAC
jgi:hypothetical protein